MAVERNITRVVMSNELAEIVGRIQRHHPLSSLELSWKHVDAEQTWVITADTGTDEVVYLVDETWEYEPATPDEVRRINAGVAIHGHEVAV